MKNAAKTSLASTFFDSHAQVTIPGTRGPMDARHLVLRAEGFDIHVKVWGTSSNRRLTGQILAREAAFPVGGARLHLLRDGERLAVTTADKLGEFSFGDVPEGPLNLQIDLPDLIVIGALNLDVQ